MTARRVAGLLVRLLGLVVLIASTTYLLVYLYRWEWNRALLTGLFVLAAELAVIGGSLSRRLRNVERLLELQEQRSREQRIRERLAAAPTPKPVSFAWLRDASDGTPVFVPVLLGAGAVLSAVAYVVERIAIATADPALQRDVAARLTRLTIPEGGFLPRGGGSDVGGVPPDPTSGRQPPARRVLVWTVIALVAALFATAGMITLAHATQARGEPDRSDEQTSITIALETRVPSASTRETFDLLWSACRARVPRDVAIDRVQVRAEGLVRVTLDHGLGRTSARKLGGCIEDALLDLVTARITEMVVLTGDPGDPALDPRWDEPAP